MILTRLGISMNSMLSHPEKAELPIEVTDFGISILGSFMHLENKFLDNFFNFDFIFISMSEVQFENAPL